MAEIDFDALADEALDLLQRYLRVDTTNPPGNEALACDFLAEVLASEGIESRRIESAPGRANLYALLSNESHDKQAILLNHTDVVPVEPAHWQVDAFAGIVKDGYVWGRGSLDMKSMAVLELMSVLTLKRRGVRLRRPVAFLAVADEEAGSAYGIEWLDKHHPELLDAAFVFNEGGYGAESFLGVERPLFGISTAEKSPLWLSLSTTGRPGHGSAPHEDNCLDRMVRALGRVAAWERPPIMTEPVLESLRAARAEGYLELDPDRVAPAQIAATHSNLATILSNTISATGLHAGMKHNVIPASAGATLDCRLVPGYAPEQFIDELRARIDDPKVTVETVFGSASPIVVGDPEVPRAIREVASEVLPEAAVLPRVSAGFTDSRTFRRRGVPAYGFVPMLLGPNEQGGQHGNDEKLSLKNLRLGVEMMYRVVHRLCADE